MKKALKILFRLWFLIPMGTAIPMYEDPIGMENIEQAEEARQQPSEIEENQENSGIESTDEETSESDNEEAE